ncbi:organic solute transporter subunit alpha-like isoform X2 [Ostrea edulis]|uniref:organic solute transporter subunit alpha-like isoform X2 n=1 Tax=Ostrea edulis TaxID=37623 RepID=UPI002094DEE5|nr:organic solute transporter subunit alpha-like isoform X2 [Ostrea edulis]
MSNCSEEFPYTSILYPELDNNTSVIVIGVLALILLVLTLVIYAEELWFMCRVNSLTPNRNLVIFILTLFPVLSLCCVIGLLVPRSTILMEFITSTLRGISILVYLMILIGYFDNEDKLLVEMSDSPFSFRSPPCCCCCICIHGSPITRKTLRIIKVLCIQLAAIRPFTMLILVLLWVDNKYELTDTMSTSNPGTFFQFINIASLLLAMWGAIAMTTATEKRLPESRIRAKFLSVQLTMVFSDAQKALLTLLASRDVIACVDTRGPLVQAYRYHYALLVLETFLLSLLARYAYRFQDPPYQYDELGKEKNCSRDGSVNAEYR